MLKALAGLYLRLTGWKTLGEIPKLDRCVLIAAPHTSNWDLPIMLAIGFRFGVRVNWLGKHTIFKGLHGWLFRKVGGLPVDRRSRHDTVQTVAQMIRSAPHIFLTMSPEGTRSRTEHWKSGFYHIALAADVPVVCGVLDYARKEGGFGPTFHLTGDMTADMDQIRGYYADKRGNRNELFGPVRLRDETGVTTGETAAQGEDSIPPLATEELAAGFSARKAS